MYFLFLFVVVKEFLLLDEITTNSSALLQEDKKDPGVEIHDLTCYWDKVRRKLEIGGFVLLNGRTAFHKRLLRSLKAALLFILQTLDAPSLQDVSFTVNSNQLLAVIGPVGAGKV